VNSQVNIVTYPAYPDKFILVMLLHRLYYFILYLSHCQLTVLLRTCRFGISREAVRRASGSRPLHRPASVLRGRLKTSCRIAYSRSFRRNPQFDGCSSRSARLSTRSDR